MIGEDGAKLFFRESHVSLDCSRCGPVQVIEGVFVGVESILQFTGGSSIGEILVMSGRIVIERGLMYERS